MQKYLEAKIAIILFFCVLSFLGILFWWCFSPIQMPQRGIWHCDELNTTFDFERDPAVMIQYFDEGEEMSFITCEYSGIISRIIGYKGKRVKLGSVRKSIFSSETSFVFLLEETGKRYVFVRID